MAEKTSAYRRKIAEALKEANRYNSSLEFQIMSLAGSLRTLDLVNEEIDELEETTISSVSRYGNDTIIPHPVFKIQKDAMASVTAQMKALGLTAEMLLGNDENDPLIQLTEKVKEAGNRLTIYPRKQTRKEKDNDRGRKRISKTKKEGSQ